MQYQLMKYDMTQAQQPEEPIIPVELLREMASLVYDFDAAKWKFPAAPLQEWDRVRDNIYREAKEAVIRLGIQDTPPERLDYAADNGALISMTISYFDGKYPAEWLNAELRDTGRAIWKEERKALIIPIELVREMGTLTFDHRWRNESGEIVNWEVLTNQIRQAAKEAVIRLGIQDTPPERYDWAADFGELYSFLRAYVEGKRPVEDVNRSLRDTGRAMYLQELENHLPSPEDFQTRWTR